MPECFTQPFLHRAQRFHLLTVQRKVPGLPLAWLPTPSAGFQFERGGVGKRSSLINLPSGRLAVWPSQHNLLWSKYAIQARQKWRRSLTVGTQSLLLAYRMRRMLSKITGNKGTKINLAPDLFGALAVCDEHPSTANHQADSFALLIRD